MVHYGKRGADEEDEELGGTTALRVPLLSAAAAQRQRQRGSSSGGTAKLADGPPLEPQTHFLGFGGAVVLLTKAVIGGALLSVPRALVLLGTLGFGVGFTLVSVLTVVTINFGLVFPSVLFDRKGTALRLGTYPAAVRHWVGGAAERVLTLTMLAGLLLAQTSYFDIFTDILVGDEANPGLLASLVRAACGCKVYAAAHTQDPACATGNSGGGGGGWMQALVLSASSSSSSHNMSSAALRPHAPSDLQGTGLWLSGPALLLPPASNVSCGHHEGGNDAPSGGGHHEGLQWWLMLLVDRRVALALMVVLVLLPLSLKRHMGATAAINGVGVAALGAFLATVVTLGVAAVRAGQAHALPLWPDWAQLTGGGAASHAGTPGGSQQWVRQAASALGVLSVLLTANSCYSNVHPMLSVVRPFTRQRAGAIVAVTITLTTAFYTAVSACAYLAFGPNIQGDVLQNLSPVQMEPLVGPVAAHAMALTVRIAYLVSILASAVLNMFPLRQVLADTFLGAPPQPASWMITSGPQQQHQQDAARQGVAGAGALARTQSDAMGFAATLSSDDEEEEQVSLEVELVGDEELGRARGTAPPRAAAANKRAHTRIPVPGRLSAPGSLRPLDEEEEEEEEGGVGLSWSSSKQLSAALRGALAHHAAKEEGTGPLVVLPGTPPGAHQLACSSHASTITLSTFAAPAPALLPLLGKERAPPALTSSTSLPVAGLEQLQLLHAATAREAEVALAQALERHASWRRALHVPLTVGTLVLTFVLAVAVPNIWMAMSLLGSVSASIVSFVMPALVGLFALQPLRLIGVGRAWGLRGVLYLTAVLGLVIFANGWLTLALA